MEGISVALLSPPDQKNFMRITRMLNLPEGIPDYHLDHRYNRQIVERLSLARKLASMREKQSSQAQKRGWIMKLAAEADIAMDDELLEEAGLTELDKDAAAPAAQSKRKGKKGPAPGAGLGSARNLETAEARKYQDRLNDLLQIKLIPKGTSRSFITAGQVVDPDDNSAIELSHPVNEILHSKGIDESFVTKDGPTQASSGGKKKGRGGRSGMLVGRKPM